MKKQRIIFLYLKDQNINKHEKNIINICFIIYNH
jgi:hypothetical protein